MKTRALSLLCGLLLAAGPIGTACQQPAPKPKGRTVLMSAPERPLTLCERPAAAPTNAQDPSMEASFRSFATGWLDKVRRAGAAPDAPSGRFLVYDQYETELRPTASKVAPWVGVLRYCEQELRCSEPGGATCWPWQRTVVTEIFRFQAGEWLY